MSARKPAATGLADDEWVQSLKWHGAVGRPFVLRLSSSFSAFIPLRGIYVKNDELGREPLTH